MVGKQLEETRKRSNYFPMVLVACLLLIAHPMVLDADCNGNASSPQAIQAVLVIYTSVKTIFRRDYMHAICVIEYL